MSVKPNFLFIFQTKVIETEPKFTDRCKSRSRACLNQICVPFKQFANNLSNIPNCKQKFKLILYSHRSTSYSNIYKHWLPGPLHTLNSSHMIDSMLCLKTR